MCRWSYTTYETACKNVVSIVCTEFMRMSECLDHVFFFFVLQAGGALTSQRISRGVTRSPNNTSRAELRVQAVSTLTSRSWFLGAKCVRCGQSGTCKSEWKYISLTPSLKEVQCVKKRKKKKVSSTFPASPAQWAVIQSQMYVAAVRSWTSNCPCRKPPVRDTGHKTEFQIYPSVYLPPHHHLTIPDSRTPNAPQISSHEIMSVCSSDAGNSWGQSKHGCPQFCPLMKVGSRSAGRGRGLACPPQCVPTQLWPSQGSYWILPSWLRFQVRLGAPGGNLCQVYSVSAVSRAGVRRCFATLVQQTAQTRTLFFSELVQK